MTASPGVESPPAPVGHSLTRGEVLLPALALHWKSMLGNIRRLQSYCDEHGAWLAPHGKTTMVPQIFSEQLAAGAWAITVATLVQAEVCAAAGVPRVLLANEPTTSTEFGALAALLADPAAPELFAFVDDAEVLVAIGAALRHQPVERPLGLLVELGRPSGRAGVRSLERAVQLARLIGEQGPHVELAGVAGYEGLITAEDPAARLEAVDGYLRQLMATAAAVARSHDRPLLVSAGGSAFFDRVVERFEEAAIPAARLVLRSGTYVTHDHGLCEAWSPMRAAPERRLPGPPLQPALELWAAVVSRPEPNLAILGFGRRNAGDDNGLPVPLAVVVDGETRELGPGHEVTAMNDQHAYVRLPRGSTLRPGDQVVCGISHPCTVFDKWRTVLVVDDERTITGAVHTHF